MGQLIITIVLLVIFIITMITIVYFVVWRNLGDCGYSAPPPPPPLQATTNITCAHCERVNLIPTGTLRGKPPCRSCGRQLIWETNNERRI